MSPGFGFSIFFGLLIFAGFIAMIVSLVHTVIIAVTLPRRMPREACCDGCRYPIAGLTGWTCPECGSDLRTVGVTTPALEVRRRGNTLAATLAWTILVVFVGGYAAVFISAMVRTSSPPWWQGPFVLIMLFSIWALGLTSIIARRRRLRRRHGVGDPNTPAAAPTPPPIPAPTASMP